MDVTDEGMMQEEGMFADEADDIPLDFDIEDNDGGSESLSDEENFLGSDDDETVKYSLYEPKTTWTDQVKMIHLRRYIDQLAQSVQENNYEVQKTREELKKCREHIEELEKERNVVIEEIQQAENTENSAALYRLRANNERLCQEIENEVNLETKIAENLDKAEYELARAQVEQGKLLLAEDDLRRQENKLELEQAEQAEIRARKEQDYADQALRTRRAQQRAEVSALHQKQQQYSHQIDEAVRSQEKASKFLEKTVSKMRQRSAEEHVRQKEHMEKRMTSMLKLKKDITNNRENLRALQARDRALLKQQEGTVDRTRQAILSAGGNPSEEMIKQQKLEEFEREKQLFKLKQRDRQIDIAEKILEEQERMKRRKQQQSYLFPDTKKENAKIVKPHRRRKVKMLESSHLDANHNNYQADLSKYEGRTGDESDSDDGGSISPMTMTRNHTLIKTTDPEEEKMNTLAKPEFAGMWDKHKAYKVPKDVDTGVSVPGASKMDKSSVFRHLEGEALDRQLAELGGDFQDEEQAIEYVHYLHGKKMAHKSLVVSKRKEILKKVLDKHKDGIIIKQVAGGREFTGKAFNSKPEVIHFKDFDVGKTYKKKVTLTNVSYSVNYCKLVGLTEHLKDFVDLHFDPPGQMSAGLTCELLVTFKPMINEDLSGEVQFLAQTGPFTIPLVCTTKKCDLKVDKTTIEFGVSVIGETVKRTFTLSNNGALGTKFEFAKTASMKLRSLTSAGTSLGRLTTTDTNLQEEKPEAEAGPDKQKGKVATDNSDAKGVHKETEGSTEEGKEVNEPEKGEGEVMEKPTGFAFSDDSDALLDRMEDLYTLDGMSIGPVSSREIGPFSTVKLEIVWQPTIPGKVDTDFCITFEDPELEKINVVALANAIDVPVWVERHAVDLDICMFDRLYQDTIIVNNRATTALRLKFEVCKELRNHLELLPKTGYIQAQSQFSAQLKFLPRQSLFQDASKYFDKETGVLEAPMVIRVADQTRPVPFTVHAVVTNSDLEFDVQDIDFGHCTIYESTTKTVQLVNHSILPQQFGFLGIPEYIDVQPNDGFGTLLPMETVELDIIFSPSKARDYNFELTCKSLINREFKISCRGVGVHPPLELSDQVVHFGATTINDVSVASFHVVNAHTSTNEFTHPVPRIGKGEIAPVGPTSFEFVVPEGSPVSISPSVGTVEPGKKCHVHVRFAPRLDDADIRKEAVRMTMKAREQRAQEEYKAALDREKEQQEQQAQAKGGKKGGGATGGSPSKGKVSPTKNKGKPGGDSHTTVTHKGPAAIQVPQEDKITTDSNEYAAAHASLLRQFRGKFQSLVIPCYVASGKCGNPGDLSYSVHNTLYLKVHCPAIKPELVVISDNGRSTIDFGDVSIGQSVVRSVTVQNISDRTLDLRASCLDTAGPFVMLNALRVLPPDASHTMIMCYIPNRGEKFQEVLEVLCPSSTLHLTLKGRGVSPMVSLSIKQGVMDIGAIIAGEYREETFKIMNTSTLSVQYCIKLDSQSLLRYAKAQELPYFVKRNSKMKSLIGTQNNNGQQVFDCVPSEGSITAGGSKEITVTFAPDHASDHFSDGVRIELFGQEEQHMFRVEGQAMSHIMYMGGGDPLLPEVESLSAVPPQELDDDAKPPPRPLLVTLFSVAKETDFVTATRDIHVGCVRTMALSQKKNGEWVFDSVQPITALGFTIDPVKGMIEAATKRPITITWTPPPGHDTNQPMEASILCTVKGDVTEQYRIILRGIVTSE